VLRCAAVSGIKTYGVRAIPSRKPTKLAGEELIDDEKEF
tara:strand:+ start:443 stop:559 length:117 start_codon:yes stop_codon:yes gene_type:complete